MTFIDCIIILLFYPIALVLCTLSVEVDFND